MYLFNGNDEAEVKRARQRWKEFKESDCEMTYWKQDAKGKWERGA